MAVTSSAIVLGAGLVGGVVAQADTVKSQPADAAADNAAAQTIEGQASEKKDVKSDGQNAEPQIVEDSTETVETRSSTITEDKSTDDPTEDSDSTDQSEQLEKTGKTGNTDNTDNTDNTEQDSTNQSSTDEDTDDPTDETGDTPDGDTPDSTDKTSGYSEIDPDSQNLTDIVQKYYEEYEAAHAADSEASGINVGSFLNGLGQDTSYWGDDPAPVNAATLTQGSVTDAWEEGYQGQGIVVAVIDNGLEDHQDMRLSDETLNRQDVQDEIATAEDFISEKGYGTYVSEKIPFAYNYSDNDNQNTASDTVDHGMHVAGIIAANGDAEKAKADGTDYAIGIAPEAQILDMRVLATDGHAEATYMVQAIHDAVELGANVINMSIGDTYNNTTDYNYFEQAVRYAVDHGVVVVISAGNSGSRAQVSSANAKEFDPENTETITNPGTTPEAITVAATRETLQQEPIVTNFSSRGPNSDYSLKPDIAAPGDGVQSTMYEDGYQSLSGTSMASPYVAGAAALVVQRLKATTDLEGAELVQAVKLALMNSTNQILNPAHSIEAAASTGVSVYESTKIQGSGIIDVAAAQQMTVSAQGVDQDGQATGTGSVSLFSVDDSTDFQLLFTNYGTNDISYTYDPGSGSITTITVNQSDLKPEDPEYDAAGSGIMLTESLEGATIDPAMKTFTVKAGQQLLVGFTLNLDNTVEKNQSVEGFLNFKTSDPDGVNNISVPFLAYYGDLTDENVFDAASLNRTNYLENGKHLPLGIGSNEEGVAVVAENGGTNFANDGREAKASTNSAETTTTDGETKVYGAVREADPTKAAISPNGDGENDEAAPVIYLTDNLASIKTEILDDKGNVVRVLDNENDLEASGPSLYQKFHEPMPLNSSQSLYYHPEDLQWDGKVFDQATGEQVAAADGQYTYRVIATLNYEGEKKEQSFDLPVIVDTVKPEMTVASFDASQSLITFNYSDKGAGFTNHSLVILHVGDEDFEASLDNDGTTDSGAVNIELDDDLLSALQNSDGQVTITIHDVAGNSVSQVLDTGYAASNSSTTTSAKAPTFNFYVQSPSGKFSPAILIDFSGWGFELDNERVPKLGALVDNNDCEIKAKVSGIEGTQYFVRNIITGQVFGVDHYDEDGNAIFEVSGVEEAYHNYTNTGGAIFQGYAISPTAKAGVYVKSLIDAVYVPYIAGTKPSVLTAATANTLSPMADPEALLAVIEADPAAAKVAGYESTIGDGYNDSHLSNDTLNGLKDEIANHIVEKGHLIDIDHTRTESPVKIPYADGDYYYAGQDVVTDTNVGLNSTTYISAEGAEGYDPVTGLFTITGHLNTTHSNNEDSDISGATFYILGNSSDENDPLNRVKVDKNGDFSYSVAVEPNTDRNVGYILLYQLKNADGTFGEVRVKRGSFGFVNDSAVPLLTSDIFAGAQKIDDDTYEITTYANSLDFKAAANDNSEGYKVTFNGNQLFRQVLGGYESIAIGNPLDGTASSDSFQPFGAYDIDQVVQLNNGDNYVVVQVEDTLGNITEKTLRIVRVDATSTTLITETPNLSTRASEKAQAVAEAAEAQAKVEQEAATLATAKVAQNTAAATSTVQLEAPQDTAVQTTAAEGNLPKMGEQENKQASLFGAVLLSIASLFGLAGFKKSRKED